MLVRTDDGLLTDVIRIVPAATVVNGACMPHQFERTERIMIE